MPREKTQLLSLRLSQAFLQANNFSQMVSCNTLVSQFYSGTPIFSFFCHLLLIGLHLFFNLAFLSLFQLILVSTELSTQGASVSLLGVHLVLSPEVSCWSTVILFSKNLQAHKNFSSRHFSLQISCENLNLEFCTQKSWLP